MDNFQLNIFKPVIAVASVFLTIGLSGCGGNKLLDDPKPLVLERPLVSTSDGQCELHLDWVIVRDGPGTWASNANWDEYLLRARNLSAEPIRITGVAVYDSLSSRAESSANINKLTNMSKKTERRYRAENFKVKAGVGGEKLLMAGAVAYAGGTATAISTLAGGASVSAGAAGAAAALVLAPVLIVGGTVKMKRMDWVARELVRRQTPLPLVLAANELQSLTIFFPLAPSPQRIELFYSDSRGEHKLAINIENELRGLHIMKPATKR